MIASRRVTRLSEIIDAFAAGYLVDELSDAVCGRMARRTALDLWLLRLSITTMSRDRRVGTRHWATQARKLVVRELCDLMPSWDEGW